MKAEVLASPCKEALAITLRDTGAAITGIGKITTSENVGHASGMVQ